jgi:hypothetical protein
MEQMEMIEKTEKFESSLHVVREPELLPVLSVVRPVPVEVIPYYPPVVMPEQPKGYVKAPRYDFF